ncbi:hypothetical protein EMIT0180MI3_360005 [Priestia megaterium]
MQGLFDPVQIAHPDAGRVAIVALEGLPAGVEKIQRGADTQGLADVTGHRLLRRTVPLHPVEGPHVPQLRVVHRRVGHAVVGRRNGVAEAGVGNAPEGVGTAGAFFGGVEPAMGIVPGHFQEGIE